MDSVADIKRDLISRIEKTTDIQFLKVLREILDSSEKEVYQLSPEQQKSIAQGREQIKEGKFRNNEFLIAEMKEWLEKK